MGKLNLGTMSEDEMIQALAAKEDEYAALGAPIDSVVETVSEPAPAPAVDPAQALAGGVGSSGPAGTPRDYVHEYMELVTKGTTVHDQARANAILAELNKSGQKDKIRQITDALSARPILPSGM